MRTARWLMIGFAAAASTQAFSHDATAADQRNYAAGQTYLSFDGNNAGFLTSIAQTQTSSGYQEVATFAPAVMTSQFYSLWFSPVFQQQRQLKNVSLTAANYNGQAASVTSLPGAAISEIDLPAFDAASKDPLLFTAKFSAPSGQVSQPAAGTAVPAGAVAALSVANFKLLIDGLDATRVSKIDAITITSQPNAIAARSTPAPLVVNPRAVAQIPNATVTYSHLIIQVAAAYSSTFQTWLSTAATTAKSGSISLLKSDLATTWGTFSLSGLKINSIVKDTTAANANQIQQVTVDMTIGSMSFAVSP